MADFVPARAWLRAVVTLCAAGGLSVRLVAAPLDPTGLEQRVESLLGQLSQQEKIQLMAGGSTFGTAAIPRVGVPALSFADGPNGVRSNNDEVATVFPLVGRD